MATFNPNEIVIRSIRSVESFNPTTKEFISRSTLVRDPSLTFTADTTDVVDGLNTPIMTFYDNQTGTFGYTNSVTSLDLMEAQFGTDKVVADTGAAINVPTSEVFVITNNKVELKYVPVGTAGAEIPFVALMNADNTKNASLKIDASASATTFTLDAATKTLTFDAAYEGFKVLVRYDHATENAVKVYKTTDSVPQVQELYAYCTFHNICDKNIVYSGCIHMPHAEVDISSVDVGLTPDGGHQISYLLRKDFCADDGIICEVFVDED